MFSRFIRRDVCFVRPVLKNDQYTTIYYATLRLALPLTWVHQPIWTCSDAGPGLPLSVEDTVYSHQVNSIQQSNASSWAPDLAFLFACIVYTAQCSMRTSVFIGFFLHMKHGHTNVNEKWWSSRN